MMKLCCVFALLFLASVSRPMSAERTGKFFFVSELCYPKDCPKPGSVFFVPIYCFLFYSSTNKPCMPKNNTMNGTILLLAKGIDESSDYTDLDDKLEVGKKIFINNKEYAVFKVMNNNKIKQLTPKELIEDTFEPI